MTEIEYAKALLSNTTCKKCIFIRYGIDHVGDDLYLCAFKDGWGGWPLVTEKDACEYWKDGRRTW